MGNVYCKSHRPGSSLTAPADLSERLICPVVIAAAAGSIKINTGSVCHGDTVTAYISVTGFHGPPSCFAS